MMKTVPVLSVPVSIESAARPRARATSRLADYAALTRPRIVFMALVTVLAGAWMASRSPAGTGEALDWGVVLHALAGTALVAAGAGALNQWWERDVDARMERTRRRPLPAGRIGPAEALAFGALLAAGGLAVLASAVNGMAGVLAAAALASYLLAYTPLKRVTTLNTAVGAVPGAIPALIGWAAARDALEPAAWGLFGIVFLWQFPHFLAIARMYRDDYARAGLKMLAAIEEAPAAGGRGTMTGRQAANYTLALLPVSLLPALMGAAGPLYFCGAFALGAGFLVFALRFALRESVTRARHLLRASIVYLPALLTLLMLDLQ